MRSILKKAGLAIALGATALVSTAPAQAQYYRGYHGHRGHDDAGPAIVAGIAGLAIGAAIASDRGDRYYRDRYYYDHGRPAYYDDYYYRDHGYYPSDGYYAYRYRGYSPRCYTERRWDPYYGQPVRIRVCR